MNIIYILFQNIHIIEYFIRNILNILEYIYVNEKESFLL